MQLWSAANQTVTRVHLVVLLRVKDPQNRKEQVDDVQVESNRGL
jgi:hypothetical protein